MGRTHADATIRKNRVYAKQRRAYVTFSCTVELPR